MVLRRQLSLVLFLLPGLLRVLLGLGSGGGGAESEGGGVQGDAGTFGGGGLLQEPHQCGMKVPGLLQLWEEGVLCYGGCTGVAWLVL